MPKKRARTTRAPANGDETEAPPLVLVVDDYQDGRELVVDVLDAAGIRTTQAADGETALREAIAQVPDAVLMDVSMPGMDGWEITRRLKAHVKTAHVPVLML